MKKKTSAILMPYIPTSISLIESFKSQTELTLVDFPKSLGEKHPFDFAKMDAICANFGLANTAVDKHLDAIISPGFYVTSKNLKAQTLIIKLLEETAFTLKIREWVREGLKKGNGFMETSVEKDTVDLKVTSANNMYVQRKKNGQLIGFNQYIGKNDVYNPDKIIHFTPSEIAHLKINADADSAYGNGILLPAMK